eukprot:Blabericola_migrator_1__3723@NODE_2114_length_3249_cov_615_548397_g1339_i0_p1_GENE_NODE_2114_length_3249_cov_615_548397_g1339_i0NODE_2114_length_3249_cov_615_548397_g1339_i0_p1_ORF_typecomplete_len426_score55_99Hydrolase_4/PF12146_8/1_8e02Hydrolase_4/PF12146_8/3_2e31Abhydrolase_6/PF12697_7/6_5e06Abhydrolase_1/PF00561_20/3_3e05DUF1100/PF06500_11/8_2e05Peptidase_S9/PF00326_21/0_0019Peptidase_S9/PF00326_21/1_2e02Abhydrolase_3/PF07859_13/0_0036DLH/PF01738_18/0_011DLH/PF01738_18/4e03AXE1/PF05448_12/0
MSTLSKVKFLFAKLHSTGHAETNAYVDWLRFIKSNEEKIEFYYMDDGHPSVMCFRGETFIPLVGYRWSPKNVEFEGSMENLPDGWVCEPNDWRRVKDWSCVKGVVFFLHGITESSRFSLLTQKNLEIAVGLSDTQELTHEQQEQLKRATAKESCCVLQFENSWAKAITDAGYMLYAADMQGHGLSQAWRGSRCNVEKFDHYIGDTIRFITTLHKHKEWPDNMPVFVSGLSMGGCIATRVVQELFRQELAISRSPSDCVNEGPGRVTIAGLLLFCPALSAERLKAKPVNRFLLLIGEWLSELVPTARLAALAKPDMYPWLVDVIVQDPLIHSSKLPVRLAWETIVTMDKIFPAAPHLPRDLAVCLIQSKRDTMTDPEGSQRFLRMLNCRKIRQNFLDYGWHFLSKEPGNGCTIGTAIKFLDEVTSQ